MSQPLIIELSDDIPNVDAYLIGMVHIHASCIEHDKTQATFLPPLSYGKMLEYWKATFDQVLAGHQHIIVELAPVSSRKAQLESPFKDNELPAIHIDQDPNQDYEVAGFVVLEKPVSETGAFRGSINKLLVSPNHRQKGVARRVMTALERVAFREGRTYLLLGTEVGSPAEQVYPRLGYTVMGVLPAWGYSPVPGKLSDEVWLYKDLKKEAS